VHRFTRRLLLFLAVATVLLLAGAAHAQATSTGTSSTSTWQEILTTWGDPQYRCFLGVVFLWGMAGGLISELISLRGRVELPHPTKPEEIRDDLPTADAVAAFLCDLGVIARLLIGGGAAILVLWALGTEEQGATAVIAHSLLAGASGGAVFQILKKQLETALAAKEVALEKKEVTHIQALQAEASPMVEEMIKMHTTMKTNLTKALDNPQGHQITAAMSELAHIDRLLGGIQALHAATISRTRAPGD